MSKYWKNMFILIKDKINTDTDSLFISQEEPSVLSKNDIITKTFSENVSNKNLEAISLFYQKNYRIGRSPNTNKTSVK